MLALIYCSYFIIVKNLNEKGAKSDRAEVEISGMISGKQGVKYAGKDVEAMSSIAKASQQSLKKYEQVTQTYCHKLEDNLLVKHNPPFFAQREYLLNFENVHVPLL